MIAATVESATFPAPNSIAASTPDKITGVTQYYALQNGSLYKVRFSLTNAEDVFTASDAHVKFVALDDNAYYYDTMMPLYKLQQSDAKDRVISVRADFNRAIAEYGPESEYVSRASGGIRAAEDDAAQIDDQIKTLEEAGREKLLYSQEFDVKASDFRQYQLIATGADVYAYMWQIDATQFSTDDLGSTKALIWVTLPNGKTFEAETSVL